MSDNTGIEWTDATWNPLRGCARVSEGCRHCYAEKIAARFSGPGKPFEGLITHTSKGPAWNGQIRLVPETLTQPLRWRRPRMIFVNSMTDLFYEPVPEEFIDQVFAVMAATPHHTYQVLTKRPAYMQRYLSRPGRAAAVRQAAGQVPGCCPGAFAWPLANVWVGVSVEDQAAADTRLPLLLAAPAAVHWISAEPLLGPVDLRLAERQQDAAAARLDWVVNGGESGPGARPMQPDWARSLRDQCRAHGVAYLFKQWGAHGQDLRRVGKKAAGRLLDGQMWEQYPQGGKVNGRTVHHFQRADDSRLA